MYGYYLLRSPEHFLPSTLSLCTELAPTSGGGGKMARTVAGREPLQTHQPSLAEARISSLVRIQDGLVGMEGEYQRAISAMGRELR